MHALGRFIQGQLERKLPPWTAADLGRASGLTESNISKLINGDPAMPLPTTVDKLARALGCPVRVVAEYAAASFYGFPMDEPLPPVSVSTVDDDELIVELRSRLRRASVIVPALDLNTLEDKAIPQVIDLMRRLRSEAAASRVAGDVGLGLAQAHLADYVESLLGQSVANRESQTQPDPARPSDPTRPA